MATESSVTPNNDGSNRDLELAQKRERDSRYFEARRLLEQSDRSESTRTELEGHIEFLRASELRVHGAKTRDDSELSPSRHLASELGLQDGVRASYESKVASPFKDEGLAESYRNGRDQGQSRVEILTATDHMRFSPSLEDDDTRYIVKVLETDAQRFGERNAEHADEAIHYLAHHRRELGNPFTEARLNATYASEAVKAATSLARPQERAQVGAAESFAVSRALDAGNRASVLQERETIVGTSAGSAGFAGAVSERVREKLAGIPALSHTAPSRSDPTIAPGRDPRLEREATPVLVAARAVGLERMSGRHADDLRVAALDKELNIRRGQGEAVDAVRLTGRDYEEGTQALNALSVRGKGDNPQVRSREVIRGKDDLEME